MPANNGVFESAAAIAGGVCVAVTQGSGVVQGWAAVGVGAVGLASVVAQATAKRRVDCEKHFAKVAAATKQRLTAINPAYASEYDDAADRLSRGLQVSFPDLSRLAALGVSSRGFVAAATEAILDDLRIKGFGFDREPEYERFARDVISIAVEEAWTGRDSFPQIEPHMWLAALRSLGVLEERADQILKAQERIEAKIDALPVARSAHTATPARGISIELSQFLQSIGVVPADFIDVSRHPDEISYAIALYLRRWQELLPRSASRDVLVRISGYPSVFPDEFDAQHDTFYEALAELVRTYPEFGQLKARNEEFPGALLGDATLVANKRVLLASSFFYRSASRKESWGMIRCGSQRAFGIVAPRSLVDTLPVDITSRDDANGYGEESAAIAQLGERHGVNFLALSWPVERLQMLVAEFVRQLSATDGRVEVRKGYVQADLLIEMLALSPMPALVSTVEDLISICPGADEAHFSCLAGSHGCALFDIGQLLRVMHGIASGAQADPQQPSRSFVFFAIQHQLDIPVGIGFSLPLLPYLLRRVTSKTSTDVRYLYEAIREIAFRSYVNAGPVSRARDFQSLGIEVLES